MRVKKNRLALNHANTETGETKTNMDKEVYKRFLKRQVR